MGTRSTVKFYDREDCIMSVYQQYDGYIEGGVGENLGRWLSTKKILNGISNQTIEQGFANGIGCLAAQYIAEHKKEIGGLYMTSADDLQEFNYVIRHNNNKEEFSIEVNEGEEFTGTLQEFLQKYDISITEIEDWAVDKTTVNEKDVSQQFAESLTRLHKHISINR